MQNIKFYLNKKLKKKIGQQKIVYSLDFDTAFLLSYGKKIKNHSISENLLGIEFNLDKIKSIPRKKKIEMNHDSIN